ncbi:hypothetical protein BJX64DRAFT_288526 [Aspergillus heterothallicus]
MRSSVAWFLLLAAPAAAAEANNNTLTIYESGSLDGASLPPACVEAMVADVACYPSLGSAVLQTSAWSLTALAQICTDECTESLSTYIASVDDVCGTDNVYNISGTIQMADSAAKELLWKQTTTCLKDPDSGEYCNTILQHPTNNTDSTCQYCALSYLTTVTNSVWGQQIASPDDVASLISSCSASGYSVTYTPTTTSVIATETGAAALSRCNATDPDATIYTTDDSDTCFSISRAFNVSTRHSSARMHWIRTASR